MAKQGKKRGGKQTKAKARPTKRTAAGKKRQIKKTKRTTSPKKRGSQKSKKGSDYNLHMKKTLSQVKTDNPHLSHSEAFKMAAQQWSTSPENPKNK